MTFNGDIFRTETDIPDCNGLIRLLKMGLRAVFQFSVRSPRIFVSNTSRFVS